MMLRSLLLVSLHLLLFSCQAFSLPFSNEQFVKRAGGLVPNPGRSGSTNQNGQTPGHPNVPSAGSIRNSNDGNRAPAERPPELPATHPIGPPNLSRVQYEEDRRPSLLQRLTGNGDKKGKKRTQYEMANDREASSSGMKEPSNEQVKKRKKATAEDVHRMLDEIVEARKRQSQRRSHYQSPEERKYWKDLVGGGLAATATGVGLLANEGKKAYRKVKDACIGACRRLDQRIQRHFERKGWSEPSQPLRPGVQQFRSNQDVPRPGSWQYRQELATKIREGKEQRRRERARQTQVKRLGRSNSAPPNYQKPSKDKRLSRSRSLP